MTEPTPAQPSWPTGNHPASDPLAARLLAVRRALETLDLAPEVRTRLNMRFMAICTAAKMPGASRASCAERLNSLLAAAEEAVTGLGKQV